MSGQSLKYYISAIGYSSVEILLHLKQPSLILK